MTKPFKKVVGFLQNAWSKEYAGGCWPRELWLTALMRSRSGQRLRTLIERCPEIVFYWDNTTPVVGATPGSIVPPSKHHIQETLWIENPDAVVTFGKQAAVAIWPLVRDLRPLLILPHPAYRLVTNALYRRAGHLLSKGFDGTVVLTQRPGRVVADFTKGTVYAH
jgi:hypothetical protein